MLLPATHGLHELPSPVSPLSTRYITEDPSLSDHILQTRVFHESYTGFNAKELLRIVATKLNVSKTLVTGDAGSNVCRFTVYFTY